MTTLTVVYQGTNIQQLTVSGHAGFADSGRDIVCAAIGVLITTSANALETVAGVLPEVMQNERTATIQLTLPNEVDEQTAHDAQVVLRTVLQGFKDVASEYPKHLKIIDGRKSSC